MMLLSAPQADAEILSAPLEEMTGKLLYAGERPDLAAFQKLAGNGLIIGLSGLLGDLLAMGQHCGVAQADLLQLLDQLQVGAAIRSFGKRVAAAGERPATFELVMARKDVGLMVEAAGEGPLAVLPGVASAMDRAIAEGREQQDFAVYARRDRS